MPGVDEQRVLAVAAIVADSVAMNEAFLSGDYDEARFRAQLMLVKADVAGLTEVALASAFAVERLGPVGSEPLDGVAVTFIRIANALDAVTYAAT